MKCPKCGSEIKRIILNVGAIESCTKCNILDVRHYKIRLERVLNKFEKTNQDFAHIELHYKELNDEEFIGDYIEYYYKDKRFTLNCGLTISLKTVESILDDLEKRVKL